MKYLIYIIWIILLLVVNLAFFGNLKIAGQIPNLLFLLIICFSLGKKGLDFIFVSFFCGLLLDFYSANFFGGFTLSFLLTGMILHLFSRYFAVSDLNLKTLGLVLVLALVFLNLILWLYGFAAFKLNWTGQELYFGNFVAAFLPGLLYNFLLLYPIYLLTAILEQFIHNLEIRRRGVVR